MGYKPVFGVNWCAFISKWYAKKLSPLKCCGKVSSSFPLFSGIPPRLMWKNWAWCLDMKLLFSRSVVSDCLCPHDHSMPGLPVLHHLRELAQTHVHWVGDANQSSHPLSSPSAPAFNLSQHQGLFQWVGSSHQHSTPHENCRECWRENWDRGSVVIQFNMVILVNSQHNRDILMTTCS